MIQIKLPFYIRFTKSFQWLPTVIKDDLGTEVWWLNIYLAMELGGKEFPEQLSIPAQ